MASHQWVNVRRLANDDTITANIHSTEIKECFK